MGFDETEDTVFPDIRRHELQHEELLMRYPDKWLWEIVSCCGIKEEK